MDQTFDLADVLTVTSGILIPPAEMEAVYRILGFLTGYNLYTHQLPAAGRIATPWIVERYPALAGIRPSDEERATWRTDLDHAARWLTAQRAVFGERLALSPMPTHRVSSAFGDPIGTLEARVGKERMIVIEL